MAGDKAGGGETWSTRNHSAHARVQRDDALIAGSGLAVGVVLGPDVLMGEVAQDLVRGFVSSNAVMLGYPICLFCSCQSTHAPARRRSVSDLLVLSVPESALPRMSGDNCVRASSECTQESATP